MSNVAAKATMFVCLPERSAFNFSGKDEARARDLFYALWIPDLFMERVESDGDWSLFCPDEAKGLHDVWGEKFEELYIK